MSRADEIAQGLRDESGCLTFPLDALEYSQGCADYEAGKAPPRLTSTSYDLGRAYGQRRQQEAAQQAAVLAEIEAAQARSRAAVRALLIESGDAAALAEYDARVAEIAAPPQPGKEG